MARDASIEILQKKKKNIKNFLMYRTFFLLATSSRIEILNYYNRPFYYTGIEHSRIERLFLTFLKEFLTRVKQN